MNWRQPCRSWWSWRTHQGAEADVRELILPVRTHANAVTSRAYKQGAVVFING